MSWSTNVSCSVQRLHLRAPDETLIARGIALLEDALRSASLPAMGSRVLFIRRTTLGRFSPSASTQTLSLAIEKHIAAIASAAVHGAMPSAPHAPAVWFRDPLEAHTLLALKVARDESIEAWFWGLAVPAIAAVTVARERLRAITFSVARLTEARVALPHYAAELVTHGHGRQLVDSLTESDAGALLSTYAARVDARTRRLEFAEPVSARPHFNAAAVDEQTTSADSRLRWIGAMLRARGMSADRVHVRELRSNPGAKEISGAGTRVSSIEFEVDTHSATAETSRTEPRGHHVATTEPMGADRVDAEDDPEICESGSATARQYRTHCDETPWPSGIATAAGGLLFLLPVLGRVGYAEWLHAEPEWESAEIERRVLRRVCEQLRLPEHDPAWELTISAKEKPPQPRHARHGIDGVTRAWLVACCRWLRRHAPVGLSGLVMRSARLSLTPTHVDVEFALSDISIAVRRAGLDIDPGWVWWFKRVVSFHYRSGAT